MLHIVYKTTNLINQKIYIGIHKQSDAQFDGYYGSGVVLRFAIEKYGIDNFVRETLFTYNELYSARDKERELVTKQFCELRDNYNVSVGGTGGNTLAGYDEATKSLIYKKIRNTTILNGSNLYTGEKLIRAKNRMIKNRTQPNNKDRCHAGQALSNMRDAALKRTGKYIWITDGKSATLIDKGAEIPEGYYFGRGENFKRFVKHTDEAKLKIAEKIKGDVCYNNGINNLKIKQNTIPPEGYVKGMIQQHCSKWITNGIESKKIKKTDILPDGWTNGRIINKRNP